MNKGRRTVVFIARTGVIAALYAVLTIFLAPISYGPVQCRISEAMTILPVFFPEAIPGLVIGCLIANIMSGWWADMVFGTFATLLAAFSTYAIGRIFKGRKFMPFLAAFPPVLFNAIILPLMWLLFASDAAFWINFASVLAGQMGACYVLGIPLYYGLKKAKIAEWGIKTK